MIFSKRFIRFNWIVLILIYLVVIAGSFVRITGSGMGCPDWPKCFGAWVPPTNAEELPENYREAYLDKRTKKVEKFTKILNAIGMEETSDVLKNNPSVYKEEPFNVQKTWIEYVNRLFGFLAGNAMLLVFFWILLVYRKSKLLWVSTINLVLMAFQAWFGSIVVATNLVPWTITIHMFMALLIIGIQIYFTVAASGKQLVFQKFSVPKWMLALLWVVFVIIFYQMFLGTQVREAIDLLIKKGIGKEFWTEGVGLPFYIHRSFSWLVLVLLFIIFWFNEKGQRFGAIRLSFLVLAMELFSGVLLAYVEMPGLVRTIHLLFASVLFGVLFWFLIQTKAKKY